ncbi:MAG: ferritin-like domain-containing protein [Polyangiaceae bacterium]|nr:ferritin-like domain-containing protein [Polyangiaceae bacterium]
MIRTRLGSWHTLFMAALGTTPFACGGSTSTVEMFSASGGVGVTGGSGGVGVTGGSGGVGVTGGSGGTASVPAAWSCTPVPLTGVDTGYVRCGEGYTHRTRQGSCPSIYPRSGSQLPPDATGGAGAAGGGGAMGTGGNGAGGLATGGSGGSRFACSEDADCTASPIGYCQYSPAREDGPLGGAPSSSTCNYGCATDADCDVGSICECGIDMGRCVPSTCRTDADCADGSLCAGGIENGGDPTGCSFETRYQPFSCQLPGDECFTNAQCPWGESCIHGEVNRTCVRLPLCGRPFCVDSAHRQASPTESASWLSSPIFVSSLDELDAGTRREIAAHYTEIALMEHASVAAFARFSLHLMSMGAPAWLLSETQRAMGDEIEHAKACFALASSYAESNVGPSRLRLEGAFEDAGELDIIVTAVKEACFGETVAAIEAAEAASVATVPAVRELLSRISDDETRHAELGWRFLAWALEHVGASRRAELTASLRVLLHSEVAEANQQGRAESGEHARTAILGAHGILSAASRGELRRAVLKDVVAPVLNSLLEASSGAELKLMTEMAALA